MIGTSKSKSFKNSTKCSIYEIIKVCDEEAHIKMLIIPINQPSKWVNEANDADDPEFNSL